MNGYERRRIVIDYIIEKIVKGEFKRDAKVPSDREIGEIFNISRFDIRKAFEALEGMGYIYSLQGRGRFVKRTFKRIKFQFLSNRGFSEKIKGYGILETENLKIKKNEYDKRIYEKLGLKKDENVYKLLRVRSLDGLRVAYHVSYLNGEIFKNLDNDGEEIKEIREYYKKNNIKDVMYKDIKLKIKYAGREIRYILKCGELVPIIYSEQNVMENERVIEYTEIFYRGDIFEFEL